MPIRSDQVNDDDDDGAAGGDSDRECQSLSANS